MNNNIIFPKAEEMLKKATENNERNKKSIRYASKEEINNEIISAVERGEKAALIYSAEIEKDIIEELRQAGYKVYRTQKINGFIIFFHAI